MGVFMLRIIISFLLTFILSFPTLSNGSQVSSSADEDVGGNPTVEQYGYPDIPVPHSEIRNAFISREFKLLNKIIDDFQRSMYEDFHYEYVVYNCYTMFKGGNPEHEEILDAWLMATPESYVHHVARGIWYLARSWAARGGELAKHTSKEQFEKMRRFAESAEASLARALELNPRSFRALTTQIDLDQIHGGFDESVEVVNRALEVYPESFLLRQIFIENLVPRWGGSYELMDAFAKQSQEYIGSNPKLKLLYGFSHYDRGSMSQTNGLLDQAAEHYTRALSFGEFSPWHDARASSYISQKKFMEAREDMERSLARSPQGYWARLTMIGLKKRSRDYDGAIEHLKKAMAYYPEDSGVQEKKRDVMSLLYIGYFQAARSGDLQGGMALLDKAIDLEPQNHELKIRRLIFRLEAGEKKQEIFGALTRIIRDQQGNNMIYFNVSYELAQLRHNDPEGFWAFYCSARSDDALGFLHRGLAAFQNRNIDKALDYFQTAVEKAPEDRSIYGAINHEFRQTKNLEMVIPLWDRTYKQDSGNALALFHRGDARRSAADNEGAIADFKLACELGLDWGCNAYRGMTSKKEKRVTVTAPQFEGDIRPFKGYRRARWALQAGKHNLARNILMKASPQDHDDRYFSIDWRSRFAIPTFRNQAELVLDEGFKRFPESLLLKADRAEYLYLTGSKKESLKVAEALYVKLVGSGDRDAHQALVRTLEANYEELGYYREIRGLYESLIAVHGEIEDVVRSMKYDALLGNTAECRNKFQEILNSNFAKDEIVGALSYMGLALYLAGDSYEAGEFMSKVFEMESFGKYESDVAMLSFLTNNLTRKMTIRMGATGSVFAPAMRNILYNGIFYRDFLGGSGGYNEYVLRKRTEYTPSERMTLALILVYLGHRDSLAVAEEVYQENPEHPMANYVYGLALKKKGDKSSKNHLRVAAESLPNKRFVKLAGGKAF